MKASVGARKESLAVIVDDGPEGTPGKGIELSASRFMLQAMNKGIKSVRKSERPMRRWAPQVKSRGIAQR